MITFFPGGPTNNEGISLYQKKLIIKFCFGLVLVDETKLCSIIFLHGRSACDVEISANMQIRVRKQ